MAFGRGFGALVCLGLVGALPLAGCGAAAGTQASSGGVTAQSSSGGGGAAAATGCAAWTPGKDGVVRTFCDGPATAIVTIDGKSTTVKGGSCEMSGGMFSFNLGVVVSTGFPAGKTKPDYVGLMLMSASATEGEVTMTLNGQSELMASAEAKLAADKKSAKAHGTTLSKKAASVDIVCG